MSHHVGLDVSLKEVSICVEDAESTVFNRASVPTEPDTIAEYLAQYAPSAERVVHESGILATWLTRELERRGVPITCIDLSWPTRLYLRASTSRTTHRSTTQAHSSVGSAEICHWNSYASSRGHLPACRLSHPPRAVPPGAGSTHAHVDDGRFIAEFFRIT